MFGWGLVICAISTFCGVWCGAVFQCRNFKEKKHGTPLQEKTISKGQKRYQTKLGGGFSRREEKSTPKRKARADEDLKILKSSNENRSVLNYSRGRRGN